jgi:hypothetical protein
MRTEIPMPICAGETELRATVIISADKKPETARLILIRIGSSLFLVSQNLCAPPTNLGGKHRQRNKSSPNRTSAQNSNS